MPVTLTANYKETLRPETVELIDNLLEDNYALDDMLEFIDEKGEDNFIPFYEEYCRCGEEIGYEVVDALIEEMGCMSYIEGCDERYRGCYESVGDYAQQLCDDLGYSVPDFVVVDWEATWEQSLRYDHTACEVGYRQVHIFTDN